jgi:repressor LexA
MSQSTAAEQQLTPRQYQLMTFIQTYYADKSYMPALDDMSKYLGLSGRPSALRIIRSLERKKYIRRAPKRARAIEILRPVGISG